MCYRDTLRAGRQYRSSFGREGTGLYSILFIRLLAIRLFRMQDSNISQNVSRRVCIYPRRYYSIPDHPKNG
ncbi:dna-(apurinic or apyrimidinic site) lyase [Moniliophthora roreri]|nr:dna-(apurinic or apyrimidinic site) lyase [Moniliophthora roreri]